MGQIIIITVVLLFYAIAFGLLYAAVRCAIRFPKVSLILITILISGSVLYYKHFDEHRKLCYIPQGLKVEKILYANEESWGFGPGGNEVGVIVYELPNAIAERIRKVGIDYFYSLPSPPGYCHDRHHRYENWYSTPIPYNDSWRGSESDNNNDPATFVPKIKIYIDQYGFSIPIDPAIESMIDSAISKKGSYFAYGRIGMLIVIPDTGKIVYVYRG